MERPTLVDISTVFILNQSIEFLEVIQYTFVLE